MSTQLYNNIKNVSLGLELRYEFLKDFLDIGDALQYLGIKYHIQNDELMANCPYHNDTHPSWSIKYDKSSPKWGVHSCFSCRASGNIVSLVRDQLNFNNYFGALCWLEEFSGITSSDIDIEKILIERKTKNDVEKREEDRGLIEFNFPYVRSNFAAYEYIKGRGVDERQIDTHGIRAGIGKYANSVIFPIRNEYGVVSFYARFYDGPMKSLYASGKDKIKNTLYNFYNCDLLVNTCYLVEGCFDVLAVERSLFSMGNSAYRNVFATLGPILHKQQKEFLDFFDFVIVIPDMKGGAESLLPSCKELLSTQKLYVVEVDKGEDPDSMNLDRLSELLTNPEDARKTTNTLVIDYGM